MSRYPGQLDTNAELTPVADNATEIAAESINSLREAIFAIQRALGTDPHGTASDLKTRLEQILNPDGTFKSAALTAAGLIALPITNSMVGSAAAIVESKLNLDVPTQNLQNQISSNDIDISSLQSLYNSLIVSLANHTNGASQRHDGYQIDVSGGLEYAPAITTVGQALDFIYGQLIAHMSADAVNQHPASAISYVPDPSGPFTATNVQDAVTQIDTAFQEDRRKHNDLAHSSGAASDGYGAYAGQVSPPAAMRVSRYQPSSGQDQIKVAHINASAIKTKGLDPLGLSSTAQALDFYVTCGTASRTISVTGLHTAQYPATNNRFALKALVDHLNASFAHVANHFPLQAYEFGGGEIVIQHNIARDDCTVSVQSPLVNSAINAFGFAAIDSVIARPNAGAMMYVDGYQHSTLSIVSYGQLVLGATSSILDLGTMVGAGGLGLEVGHLLHIYNHTSASSCGTYSIASVGYPPSTQINLTTTVNAGSFDYIIYRDVPHLGSSANPRSVDIFANYDLTLNSVTRYSISLAPIANVSVVEVSDSMPAGSGLLQLVTGATNTLQLTLNAQAGAQTEFPSGYVGYVKVYAYDGVGYITCLISSSSLSPITSTIAIYAAVSGSGLKIASTYYDGGLYVELPLDKTPVGTIGVNAVSSIFKKDEIEFPQYISIGNGIITGLQASSPSSTQVSVLGGSVMVSGKLLQIPASTINVFNKVSSTGTWNIVVDLDGRLDIFDDTAAGYSLGEIGASNRYAMVSQFTTSSGAVTAITDARYFVSNIAYKYIPTVGTSTTTSAFATLEAANIYAAYEASATGNKIVVTSDLTTLDFSLTSDKTLECLASATFDDLIVGSGSIMSVVGQLTAETVTLQSGSTLIVYGGMTVVDSITIGTGCLIQLAGTSTAGSIVFSGSNSCISSIGTLATLTFSGATNPCISFAYGANAIIGLDLRLPSTYDFSLVQISGSAGDIYIRNCTFTRPTPIGSWVTGQIGIEIVNTSTASNILIEGSRFSNFNVAIDIEPTVQVKDIRIVNCILESCNYGIRAGRTDALYILSNTLDGINNTYIDCDRDGVLTDHTNVTIGGNTFKSEYAGGQGIAIKSGSKADAILIDGNTFLSITTVSSIIDLSYTHSADSSTYSVTNNIFDGCTAPYDGVNFAIEFSSTYSSLLFDGNVLNEHDGAMLSVIGSAVISDNIFDSQSAAGSPYVSINLGNNRALVFCNNNVVTSTEQYIQCSGATITGNYIDTGYMSCSATNAQDAVIGNYLHLRSTSASNSIVIAYSTSSQSTSIFAHNTIYTYATSNGMSVSGDGSIIISNNVLSPQAGCTAMIYAQLHTTSSTPTYICNNIINSNYSSVANSILIEKHSVYVVGNLLNASGSSPSASSINVSGSSLTNIYVHDNILGTATTAARLISTNSTQDVLITENKNASAIIPQSAIDGMQYNTSTGVETSAWTLNTTGRYLISTSTSAGLAVTMKGLPRGARIVSCVIYASVPATIGSLSAQLYERNITGTSASSISPVASNGGIGSVSITVTPSSTTFVSTTKEYFLIISSTATSNIVGNIVVNIYY